MASTEVERHSGVDVEDVPSARWGWSKESHRALHVGGILSAIFILLLLRGNQQGRTEDIYLVGFAVVILFVVARDWWLRRRGWIR